MYIYIYVSVRICTYDNICGCPPVKSSSCENMYPLRCTCCRRALRGEGWGGGWMTTSAVSESHAHTHTHTHVLYAYTHGASLKIVDSYNWCSCVSRCHHPERYQTHTHTPSSPYQDSHSKNCSCCFLLLYSFPEGFWQCIRERVPYDLLKPLAGHNKQTCHAGMGVEGWGYFLFAGLIPVNHS